MINQGGETYGLDSIKTSIMYGNNIHYSLSSTNNSSEVYTTKVIKLGWIGDPSWVIIKGSYYSAHHGGASNPNEVCHMRGYFGSFGIAYDKDPYNFFGGTGSTETFTGTAEQTKLNSGDTSTLKISCWISNIWVKSSSGTITIAPYGY